MRSGGERDEEVMNGRESGRRRGVFGVVGRGVRNGGVRSGEEERG